MKSPLRFSGQCTATDDDDGYFLVISMRFMRNSFPVFGSAPVISSTFLSAPIVSVCRIVAGFWVIGQWKLNVHVSVLPSGESAPSPVMKPVLMLSIHEQTNFLAT